MFRSLRSCFNKLDKNIRLFIVEIVGGVFILVSTFWGVDSEILRSLSPESFSLGFGSGGVFIFFVMALIDLFYYFRSRKSPDKSGGK